MDPPHPNFPKRTKDPPYQSIPKRQVTKDYGGPSSSSTGLQHKQFQTPNKNDTARSISRNFNTKKTPPKLERTTTEPEKSHLQRWFDEETTSTSSSLIPHRMAKTKVEKALSLFQTLVRNSTLPRAASKTLERRGKFVHEGKKIVGDVPGIEVGDEFQYFELLNVVGLHRAINGIDYMICNPTPIATSIVSCRLQDDELDDAKLFITTGEQGNVVNNKNQTIENCALINSCRAKKHVRVIIKLNSKNGAEKYFYYGLYKVVQFKRGKSGYVFLLVKSPDQKKVVIDISKGKENFPIPAINCVDANSVPSVFKYITRMVYPEWLNPLKGNAGCFCVGNCSDSDKCYCAKKNGGIFPFIWARIIEPTKQDMIYECGPFCTCFPKCRNKVSQNGIKFPLEIFKTETKGWGVQSKKKIPSGSFVCEYLGEVIEDEKAANMIGKDEYLFNIGNENHKDGVFTIDAAMYGNVARFINHSCHPNLVGQNVLFDHDDVRIPHIMLFAAEDIPEKTELTYNYNYKIDQVVDPNGIVKRMDCHCGTSKCVGRMY